MSAAKKGLGRGFDTLIPADLIDDSFDPTALEDRRVSQLRFLPTEKIQADPDQPRKAFDQEALDELTASVKEHGILQPIIVVQKGEKYQVVAGERRYRAATAAGLKEMPAIIRTLTDQNKLELSLIENLQRHDLNVVETATAYVKLREQFGLTNDQIGERVHKSPSAVNNTMRLLKLPKEALQHVADGTLSEGQVRPLISRDEAFILEILPRIVAEQWSARKVEQYVVNAKQNNGQAKASSTSHDEALTPQTEQLKSRLHTDVAIRMNAKGAGKIVISFKDKAEFERLQQFFNES
jgi:ParB family transcriptional regulator, chromosome partitioning protein